MASPVPFTSDAVKKNIGNLVLSVNSEILDLQKEFKRLGDSNNWSSKADELEISVKEKKEALEDFINRLEAKPGYVDKEKFQKLLKTMKTSVNSADKVLEFKVKKDEVLTEIIEQASKEASDVMEEINAKEKEEEEELSSLTSAMENLVSIKAARVRGGAEEEKTKVEIELENIDSYHAVRVKKLKEEILVKMEDHKDELKAKWRDQKDFLDYQALKEIRSEFEATYKKMRNMVFEFDRRRISDLLSDDLMDTIDMKFDEYMVLFKEMDEEKRIEEAILRKRNLLLNEYRKEKRRDIPSWPHSLPYSKFKADLLSWDKEHHLSSGSVKFGLLAEMLKKSDRVQTYEQIQTRLEKQRNESDIIAQVVTLLDAINEETIYNKLNTAWEAITTFKKEKNESLNNFFSRFETLQYSLNMADASYSELGPVKAGMDVKYYEKREKILRNRVEFNDKLKVVHLLKALGVDEAHKRDILTKIDFNKDPNIVFDDAKTAIRDICSDDTAFKSEDQVLVVKPWQSQDRRQEDDRSRRDRYMKSRSRSGGDRRFSRDRAGSRSWSRGRDRSRQRVSFQDRNRSSWRRDSTPGPGTDRINIHHCNVFYDDVYKTDKLFTKSSKGLGQVMILDCGCPRSLMGRSEFEKIKKEHKYLLTRTRNTERFKFGPSRTYDANIKVKLKLILNDKFVDAWFYVVDGEVPILLGNDVLEPLGAKIDIGKRLLEIGTKNLNNIPIIKSSGGHFVLPLHGLVPKKEKNAQVDVNVPDDDHIDEAKENVIDEEAEAVMTVLFSQYNEYGGLKKLHDEVGHKVFVEVGLRNDEEAKVMKVHRYFGHRSGRRVWELFAKARKLPGKRKQILEIIDNCETCSKMKKAPPRPKVGLPVSNDFNQVVAMDLKVVDKAKGHYILWLVDTFSKLIKGKYIKDKNPSTIIEGIISTWIIGDGTGPGSPTMGFYSDNGGEFLNKEVLDFAAYMDVELKMTSANSPWQNGIVERNHASADIIFKKLLIDNPSMNMQEAVNFAAFAKNSEINRTRFSALQLMFGQNPHFPGLAEVSSASSNLKSTSKYMRKLKLLDEARVKYREIECDEKLKKVMSERINPNVEKNYDIGDPIYFFDDKKKEWKRGTVLVSLGKTIYLKFGNFLRRVPIDKCRPDSSGKLKQEESYLEPADEEEKRFVEAETPIEEIGPELELAARNKLLECELEKVKLQLASLEGKEVNSAADSPENIQKDDTEDIIKDDENQGTLIQEKRRLKRQSLRHRKVKGLMHLLPKLHQQIIFKSKENPSWASAKVIKVHKKTSVHQNWRNLELEDGEIIEKDFANDVEEWKDANEEEENLTIDESFCMEEMHNSFPVKVLTRSEYSRPEIQAAMTAEIEKFKNFEAFEEVVDNGQYSIPIRWVVTEQKEDGKNQPYKARLCVRGDKEIGKEHIRSDSPTAAKESIKIAMIVAANEGFSIKSGDIKSAYLQGANLEREVFVKPPVEANTEGKLWKLLRGAYGMLDGGRLFYLKLADKMKDLGLHKVHSDGALFTFVKDGNLHGLVATNVDDLLMIGDDVFEEEVTKKLQEYFKFSKVEESEFTYCGCKIAKKPDGSISLDQNNYIEELKQIENVEGEDDRPLNKDEKKEARGKIGALLWISLITRADLSFDVNVLSSEVARGTVRTIKEINRVIKNAKLRSDKLRFVRLGALSELEVKVYADASFSNQDGSTKSTAGRVILLKNKNENTVNIISWKTKKIARVCRSVKTAETRAIDEAIDEAVHVARIIKEIYNGYVDLKKPSQIPVTALTDSKSLWESAYNTRQCEEKLLRNTIASIKEFLLEGKVQSIDWVPTKLQLADPLTKKGSKDKANWLLEIGSGNKLF